MVASKVAVTPGGKSDVAQANEESSTLHAYSNGFGAASSGLGGSDLPLAFEDIADFPEDGLLELVPPVSTERPAAVAEALVPPTGTSSRAL